VLRPLLKSVIARHRTTLRDQDVILDCAPDLAVWAGAEDLDRAVSNLIDNAAEHGSPPITVTAHQVGPGEPAVLIEVRDHGPGFDPGFLPRAFGRFTRADSARTCGGTGLGLAIVAALARRHGGRVTVSNHLGGGATVALTLLVAPAPIPAAR
jgi:signal transduction histidine kinase